MNFTAAVLNVALFGFTCLILLTDGLSKDFTYFLFTLFLLLVPLLNIAMIYLGAYRKGWFSFGWKGIISEEEDKPDKKHTTGKIMKATAFIGNVALLVLSCLAYVEQYPHPKEDGLIIFILFLLVTPVFSLLVIWRNGAKIILDNMYPHS